MLKEQSQIYPLILINNIFSDYRKVPFYCQVRNYQANDYAQLVKLDKISHLFHYFYNQCLLLLIFYTSQLFFCFMKHRQFIHLFSSHYSLNYAQFNMSVELVFDDHLILVSSYRILIHQISSPIIFSSSFQIHSLKFQSETYSKQKASCQYRLLSNFIVVRRFYCFLFVSKQKEYPRKVIHLLSTKIYALSDLLSYWNCFHLPQRPLISFDSIYSPNRLGYISDEPEKVSIRNQYNF